MTNTTETTETKPKFKKGDLVRLKHYPIAMVISEFCKNDDGDGFDAKCNWFTDGGERREEWFSEFILEAYQ